MVRTTVASPAPPKGKPRRSRRPRRLLLFVHYNKWGQLADYVVYLLKHVRKIYTRIVFISNSPLSEQARKTVLELCDDIVQRENKGFDFLAWKEALAREGRENLTQYDSVTLMNDTCFGPLFDLEAVYREMEAQEVDFWGLTNYASHECAEDHPLGTDGLIPEHLQSYFLCFQRAAFLSKAFLDFWDDVSAEMSAENVIKKYEVQLTAYLQKCGLKSGVWCDTSQMCHKFSYDKARVEPEVILEHRVPFLKIKAFFAWQPPENAFLLKSLPHYSRYPLALLRKHLGRHFSPETSIRVVGHRLEEKRQKRETLKAQRIALHIHAYYLDILRETLKRLNSCVHSPVDIFITTYSDDKAEEIRSLFKHEFPQLQLCQLLVCENCGRDILPWLKVAPLLAEYDIAGHLHTKKSLTATARFASIWREEILECLVERFGQILNAFSRDPELGIVIPDIPSIFRFPPHLYEYDTDTQMKTLLPEVWKRLGCRRSVDFAALDTLVFPFGNMFWYRPAALEPLWLTHWTKEDIPSEPLPPHGTLLHALERLPVYLAWERGYDFRIVKLPNSHPLGFQTDIALCEHRKTYSRPPVPRKDMKATILKKLHTQMRRRLGNKR